MGVDRMLIVCMTWRKKELFWLRFFQRICQRRAVTTSKADIITTLDT